MPPSELGPYRITGDLGRGAKGVVYRAQDTRLEREVALKLIPRRLLAGEGGARVQAEAQAAARLRHPGIVGVHDVGVAPDGSAFLVMDLVEGESLHERLAQGPLPGREAARIGARLAQALAYAHAQGVLHRDLKPANVLLTRAGEPLLTDFGLAKLLDRDQRLTHTGEVLGTPVYMSPEQVNGDPVDARTDVYGLGGILYAMLCAAPPHEAGSPLEALAVAFTQTPRPPHERAEEVDPELERIALRCLERDPAARYPDAASVADALEEWLRPRAAPPRRPVGALLLGAAAGAVLGGALVAALVSGEAPAAPAASAPTAPNPTPRFEPLLDLAEAWLSNNGPRQSLALTEAVLAQEPSAPTAWLLKARALVWRDLGAAERALEEAERAGAGALEAALVRAKLRLADQRPEAARLVLRPLLASHPNAALLRVHLAVAEFRLGQPARAQELLAEALRLDPRSVEALYYRGSVRLNLGRIEEARRDIDALLAQEPDHAGGRMLRAWYHMKRGDRGRAIEVLERALRHEPSNSTALMRLGLILQLEGRHGEAIALFDHADRCAPHPRLRQELLTYRALSLAHEGRHAEAERTLREITARNRPEVPLTQAMIHQHRGEHEEAVKLLMPLARRVFPGRAVVLRRLIRSLKALGRDRQVAAAQEALAKLVKPAEARRLRADAARLRRRGE